MIAYSITTTSNWMLKYPDKMYDSGSHLSATSYDIIMSVLLLYGCTYINKRASIGTHRGHGGPKNKESVIGSATYMISRQLHAFECNCIYNSQNCTRLHLMQLLDCYSYNYSLIAL